MTLGRPIERVDMPVGPRGGQPTAGNGTPSSEAALKLANLAQRRSNIRATENPLVPPGIEETESEVSAVAPAASEVTAEVTTGLDEVIVAETEEQEQALEQVQAQALEQVREEKEKKAREAALARQQDEARQLAAARVRQAAEARQREEAAAALARQQEETRQLAQANPPPATESGIVNSSNNT